MFEKYTDKARRAIFFARYEASNFGSPHIEPEHLLLGLLREDKSFARLLPAAAIEEFRQGLPQREKVSTSIDLPLSHPSKRVLSYAAEESEIMENQFIGPGHLALGLLRENNAASALLQQHGITLADLREAVREATGDAVVAAPVARPIHREPRAPKAASLASIIAALNRVIDADIQRLDPDQRLKRHPWTRKEAVGRLVDLATAHHQWLARALVESNLTAAGYPAEELVTAQQYAAYDWRELISLWLLMNRLLMHSLSAITEEKLTMACRLGVSEPCTLLTVIQRYAGSCEDLVGQILAKLD